jgi:alpha-methylacyl-CoA racemase
MTDAWRPLVGLRVLDLTRLLPGPFLSQVLRDLGADVVKVEEPGVGDYARHAPPEVDGAGHWFSAVNRDKRSIAVNLKAPEGVEVVRRLAARADVLLEGFRPGVLERLGLGDAVLEALNPRLVRVSLVGYAPGPYRDEAGHDLNYESIAGILAIQGEPARPALSAVPVADLAGAMYGAVGLLAALRERELTGKGRRLEVALADAAFAFNAIHLTRAASGDVPARGEWELGGAMPGYRCYRCADDRWVALGTLEPRFWDRFVDAAGESDLAPLHIDGSPEAHARMERLFATRTSEAWLDLFAKRGVPATPVLSPDEALRHPYAARFGGRPGPAAPLTQRPSDGPVPGLGEHTDAVLRELDYSQADVERLRAAGAVQ